MSVTVDTLLQLPIMQKNSQLLSSNGLNNVVQYVTVVEAAAFSFSNLGENVFVLTTLSAFHDSLEQVNKLVRGLCETKVSAIGIKLGRFIDEVDTSTIKITADYNVPLLALSSTVYFREILSDMLSVITGNQRQTLDQINNVNQALINAILQNCTMQDLLALLCNEIDCYCCCLNRMGEKIAESSSLNDGFEIGRVYETIDSFFQNIPDSLKSYYHVENTFIFPCIVQDELLAAFCIFTLDPQKDLIYPLGQSIVNGIGIKFMEQNLKAQAERELIFSILDDILFSQRSNSKVISERLKLLNFIPRRNQLIVLLSRRDFIYQERNHIDTVDNFQRIFSGAFESAVVFKRGNEYIALISYDSDAVTLNFKPKLDYCQNAISRMEQGWFDIGCSTPTTDLTVLSKCYLQAKKAIQFGRMIDSIQHVFLYENYFELGLISAGIGSDDADAIFRVIIIPIREYDKQFKTDLWVTLETCFAYDKLEQVAEARHIHISTLRYRLQKIETITGYSYFNARNRLTLYLAYLLFKVSNETE